MPMMGGRRGIPRGYRAWGRDRGVACPSCRASDVPDVGAQLPDDRSSVPGGSATPGLRLVAIPPSLENWFNVRGISTDLLYGSPCPPVLLQGVTPGRRDASTRSGPVVSGKGAAVDAPTSSVFGQTFPMRAATCSARH